MHDLNVFAVRKQRLRRLTYMTNTLQEAITTMALEADKNAAASGGSTQSSSWTIEMFHDGDCRLCNREVAMLRRLDTAGRVKFTDIARPDFDPSAYGQDLETLLAEIHARRPDGSWIRGVEVFRQLYSAVGFGCFVKLSRLPVLSQFLGLGYRVFAKNRLRLTGRCNVSDGTCPVGPGTRASAGAVSQDVQWSRNDAHRWTRLTRLSSMAGGKDHDS